MVYVNDLLMRCKRNLIKNNEFQTGFIRIYKDCGIEF